MRYKRQSIMFESIENVNGRREDVRKDKGKEGRVKKAVKFAASQIMPVIRQ